MLPSLQLFLAPTPSAAQMGMCWKAESFRASVCRGGLVLGGFSPRLLWDPQGGDRPRMAAVAGGTCAGLGFSLGYFGAGTFLMELGPQAEGRELAGTLAGATRAPPNRAEGGGQPPTCFTTHTAPLKIWQTGNKLALAPSVL